MQEFSFESEEQMFWWLIIGSKGGATRAKILLSVCHTPMNVNQLSEAISVNYRTAKFHLELMEKNGLVKSIGPKYGLVYFPTQKCLAHKDLLLKVIESGPSAVRFVERKRLK